MDAYGIEIEGYGREHGEGMYEMNLRYAPALEAADRGMLFKSGAKEVLAQAGAVPTFMAKYSGQMDGCSGHIHQSLWRDGTSAFWDASAEHGMSAAMRSYVAGAGGVAGAVRCTRRTWLVQALRQRQLGADRRDVGHREPHRAVRHHVGRRAIGVEHRVPGATSIRTGFAACLAGGLAGIERGLQPPPPMQGNVYAAEGLPPLPRTLEQAVDLLDRADRARPLGVTFVDHYVAMRRWEVKHRRAVTEWDAAATSSRSEPAGEGGRSM
jgi:glutamine synthetase